MYSFWRNKVLANDNYETKTHMRIAFDSCAAIIQIGRFGEGGMNGKDVLQRMKQVISALPCDS